MSNKKVVGVIIVTVILTFFLNLFFGRFLSAKISTWPLVNKWNILDPLAPIVINQRQEVRVSDSGDVLAALDSIKSKVSSVLILEDKSVVISGSAINITSDGYFVTSQTVLARENVDKAYMKLEDGRTAKISSWQLDGTTGLVILKADMSGVSTASLGDSASLLPGQKVIFVASTLLDHSPVFESAFVSQSQLSNISAPRDAGFPKRTFVVQGPEHTAAGQVISNTSGDVVGLWDGKEIISSAVIKNLVDSYLSGNHTIISPGFGFNYRVVSTVEARLAGSLEGARVLAIAPQSPAAKAGFLADDTITAVNGDKISEQNQLEEILQKYKPGESIKFTVARGTTTIVLTLVAGEL